MYHHAIQQPMQRTVEVLTVFISIVISSVVAQFFTECYDSYITGETLCNWSRSPITGLGPTGEFETLPDSYLYVQCPIGTEINDDCSCQICIDPYHNPYVNCEDYNKLCYRCIVSTASEYSYEVSFDCRNIFSTPTDYPTYSPTDDDNTYPTFNSNDDNTYPTSNSNDDNSYPQPRPRSQPYPSPIYSPSKPIYSPSKPIYSPTKPIYSPTKPYYYRPSQTSASSNTAQAKTMSGGAISGIVLAILAVFGIGGAYLYRRKKSRKNGADVQSSENVETVGTGTSDTDAKTGEADAITKNDIEVTTTADNNGSSDDEDENNTMADTTGDTSKDGDVDTAKGNDIEDNENDMNSKY